MNTEAVVTNIIEGVIGVKGVSRDARFLDLGGNSLNLGAVLTQIHNKTGVAVPARMFFHKTDSTIAAITAKIDAQLQESQAVLAVSR
jgi:acyl carrier protein